MLFLVVSTSSDESVTVNSSSDSSLSLLPLALGMHGAQGSDDDDESYFSDTPLVILFLPYILLILAILVLMVLSFVRFHRTHGHVYRGRLDKARRGDARRNIPLRRLSAGDGVGAVNDEQEVSEGDVIDNDDSPSSLGDDLTLSAIVRRQFESSQEVRKLVSYMYNSCYRVA